MSYFSLFSKQPLSLYSLFLIFVIAISFIFRSPFALAQTSDIIYSNCITTQVGNPSFSPVLPITCPSAGGLSQAGEDLVSAYNACGSPPGNTNPGTDSCLISFLKELNHGYPDSLFSPGGPFMTVLRASHGQYPPCTQCLGFLALAWVLYSQHASSGFAVYDAADVAREQEITSPGYTFTNIGRQTSTQNIHPGDIAVSTGGSSGHIFIVKRVSGNISLEAIESNWSPCAATDNHLHLVDNSNPLYIFRGK